MLKIFGGLSVIFTMMNAHHMKPRLVTKFDDDDNNVEKARGAP